MRSEEGKAAKAAYDMAYKKAHLKTFRADVPPQLFEEFQAAAARNKRSMADLVKEFMQQYIDDQV